MCEVGLAVVKVVREMAWRRIAGVVSFIAFVGSGCWLFESGGRVEWVEVEILRGCRT